MATRTRFARNFYSAVLALGLLSLVFLGSPGCGCGEDNLREEEGGEPERCCCEFEWLPPRIANGDDVAIVFQNVDAGLDPEATPAVLTSVDFRTLETFTVCVNEEHVIGSQFELVLRDQATNEVYTSVLLIYDTRCEPVIEPLSNYVNLTSTDCGEPEEVTCCCEFEWLPGPNQAGDVEIVAQGATAGLNPTITPNSLSVSPGESEIFEVCVSFDHPIGAQFDLVIRQAGGGAIVGVAILRYDERCIPTIVPTTAFPGLNLTSEECGGEPLVCCCNFRWLPPVTYSGNVNLTAENPSAGLNVTITPTTINGVVPRTFYEFEVCINADHSLLDMFELVITDAGGGGEVLRADIIYRLRCDADIGEMAGEPQGLTTTDCGAEQLTCCCEFEWIVSNDPDWIVPASPWTVVLENVDPSLELATITPPDITFFEIPPAVVLFEVCVNAAHTPGAAMEFVVYGPDPTGGSTPVEILRVPMDWQPTCTAAMGQPSGPGLGSVINLCGPPIVNKPGR